MDASDQEKLDRGERVGNPLMNKEELERLSNIVKRVQRAVSQDFYMITFKELGLNLPDDTEFIPKVLEIMENGGCVLNVVERDADEKPPYQGVVEAFNLKRYQRLKSEASDLDPAKKYAINFYGAAGSEISCTCGYEWTVSSRCESDDDEDEDDDNESNSISEGEVQGTYLHECPDPEQTQYRAFITFPFPGQAN